MDGFNLYHAIDDLKKPYLKWLSLSSLARRVAKGHAHSVDRVVFCTAYFPGDFDKRKRHEAYNAAQTAEGVHVLHGHTTKEPMACKACAHRWDQPREKETDINVALSVFQDVTAGAVDVIFLVTADTDQVATLRFVRKFYPAIKIVVVTPPGREKSKHLRDLADANPALDEVALDACVMPAMFNDPQGKLITRPHTYAPPVGWVHPSDRP